MAEETKFTVFRVTDEELDEIYGIKQLAKFAYNRIVEGVLCETPLDELMDYYDLNEENAKFVRAVNEDENLSADQALKKLQDELYTCTFPIIESDGFEIEEITVY